MCSVSCSVILRAQFCGFFAPVAQISMARNQCHGREETRNILTILTKRQLILILLGELSKTEEGLLSAQQCLLSTFSSLWKASGVDGCRPVRPKKGSLKPVVGTTTTTKR